MHELAVTRSILEITLEHAEAADATAVTDIYLVIGDLSSFIDDSIQFYWSTLAEGTIAQEATLHFKRVPARMQCQRCGHAYPLVEAQGVCPNCDSRRAEIVAGKEFYVEAIDIE